MVVGVGRGAAMSVHHMSTLELNSEITRLSNAVGDSPGFPNEAMAATLQKLRREKLRRDFYLALDALQASDPLLGTATGVFVDTE